MTTDKDATVLSLTGVGGPVIDDTAFVAPGARIIGDVTLRSGSSVWYNAVLRGDSASIELGEGSNIQDGVAVHVDSASPVTIGKGVSVGHNAVVHGCTIGNTVLIGMGAVVLSGAVIGNECLIAGGAVVLSGAAIPPRSLVAGVPGKVRRELTDDEIDGIRQNAEIYLRHSAHHAESLAAGTA